MPRRRGWNLEDEPTPEGEEWVEWGGLRKLLEAYNARSARPLLEPEVRFHEICLHLSWWADALDGGPGPPLDQVEPRLHNLVRATERLR